MLLGNDFESSALGFRLEHEPGGFYNLSPANTQLAAVIVERATGTPFENYVDERVWRMVGAGSAQLQLDRRAGMPAAHCCWRATARDMLRVLNLLGTDGKYRGARGVARRAGCARWRGPHASMRKRACRSPGSISTATKRWASPTTMAARSG